MMRALLCFLVLQSVVMASQPTGEVCKNSECKRLAKYHWQLNNKRYDLCEQCAAEAAYWEVEGVKNVIAFFLLLIVGQAGLVIYLGKQNDNLKAELEELKNEKKTPVAGVVCNCGKPAVNQVTKGTTTLFLCEGCTAKVAA